MLKGDKYFFFYISLLKNYIEMNFYLEFLKANEKCQLTQMAM